MHILSSEIRWEEAPKDEPRIQSTAKFGYYTPEWVIQVWRSTYQIGLRPHLIRHISSWHRLFVILSPGATFAFAMIFQTSMRDTWIEWDWPIFKELSISCSRDLYLITARRQVQIQREPWRVFPDCTGWSSTTGSMGRERHQEILRK